jgi:hypothetical protein
LQSAGAARTLWGWAAWLLLLAWPAGGPALAATVEALSSTTTPLLSMIYQPNLPEQTHLLLSPVPDWQGHASFSLSYSQPLNLTLAYSGTRAGPSGKFNLGSARALSGRLEFTLLVGPERRALIPGEQGASLQVALFPARIEEIWQWPDGLRLERTYYQPLDIPALGIRFRLHHPHPTVLPGVRIEARWYHPEILEYPDERDDDLWADPREALLLLRDYVLREENWVACGWGSPGGLVTGGEIGPDEAGVDFMVALESPARDIPAGQAFLSTLWLTWGPDHESVAAQIRQLQKQPGYGRWLEKLEAGLRQGVSFSCNDPALVELFLTHKAWMPWMVRQPASGQPPLVNLHDGQPLRPRQVMFGLESWLALRQQQAIRNYLDFWLDQRAETPDLAYTLCLAAHYYDLSRDQAWLAENAVRVEALADYLADMDNNQDGLPDYQLPPEAQTEWLGPYVGQDPRTFKELEFFDFALAGCEALKASAALLLLTRDSEQTAKAQKFTRLAALGADTLQALYWQPSLGRQGFYAFARVAGTTSWIPLRSSAAANLLRSTLGTTQSRRRLWQDLWNSPLWRSGLERYARLLAQSSWLNPREQTVDYQATHEILRQGLHRPETAGQALDRLRAYAQGLFEDVHQLGWTGRDGEEACLDPSSLNFIYCLYSGLAGLDPEPQGLRVTIPPYPQELGVTFRSLPYRGALLDVEVLGPGGGKGKILVNGKPLASGSLVPPAELAKGRVKIKILRSQPDSP